MQYRHEDEPVWPTLAPLRVRDVYRQRPGAETEECTWPVEEGAPEELVPSQDVRLASISSTTPATIVFTNKSEHRVCVLWLDFEGHEVAYSVLNPDSPKRYRTYATHPWICREFDTGVRFLMDGRGAVVGREDVQAVDITPPPELPWTIKTHSAFPRDCRTRTRAFLLAHARLERAAGFGVHAMLHRPPAARAATPELPPPAAVPAVQPGADVGTPLSPRRFPTAAPAPAAAGECDEGGSSGGVEGDTSPAGADMARAADQGQEQVQQTPQAVPLPAQQQGVEAPHPEPHPADKDRRPTLPLLRTAPPPAGTEPPGELRCMSAPASVTAPLQAGTAPGGVLRCIMHVVKTALLGEELLGRGAASARATPLGLSGGGGAGCVLGAAAAAPAREHLAPRGAHLGLMPWHVVMHIIELANTSQYVVHQSLHMSRHGRPDVMPALLERAPSGPAAAGGAAAGPAAAVANAADGAGAGEQAQGG